MLLHVNNGTVILNVPKESTVTPCSGYLERLLYMQQTLSLTSHMLRQCWLPVAGMGEPMPAQR